MTFLKLKVFFSQMLFVFYPTELLQVFSLNFVSNSPLKKTKKNKFQNHTPS